VTWIAGALFACGDVRATHGKHVLSCLASGGEQPAMPGSAVSRLPNDGRAGPVILR
jgi:hypothetical protein